MGNSRKLRRGLTVGIAATGVAAAVAAFGAGPVQAAEGQILEANTANAVPNSYIVVLKDTAVGQGVAAKGAVKANVTGKAQSLAERSGAQVKHTYGTALRGFSVQATEAQARQLAGDSDVAYVQQSHVFRVSDTQENPPSYGLDRVDQKDLPLDKSYTYSTDAADVTAYVIDTGVRATHETFGGRVAQGYDAVDGDTDADDGYGHGTHVAGTIGGTEYGLAKGVKIVPVRVLGDDGSGTTEQVVAGIDWVAENHSGPSVANMSLGGGVDETLDKAVQNAIGAGVTFAIAAGNESADASTSSPARVPEAITVAASDDSDAQASFSNYGELVDLYAPGVDITSAWNTSDTATDTISGTSMATPHVAGAAALYLAAHPDASPADVASGLTGAATADKITNPSAGTPNKLLYTGE